MKGVHRPKYVCVKEEREVLQGVLVEKETQASEDQLVKKERGGSLG